MTWDAAWAPESNPVEHIWGCYKSHKVPNLRTKDLAELGSFGRGKHSVACRVGGSGSKTFLVDCGTLPPPSFLVSKAAEEVQNRGPRVLCVGIDAMEQSLLLRWERNGRLPAFRQLLDRAAWTRLSGPPALYAGPVEWNREAPITALRSVRIGSVENPLSTKRTGDHTPRGMVIAANAGIRPGPLPVNASVLDPAPTITSCLGVSLANVGGRAIDGLRRGVAA